MLVPATLARALFLLLALILAGCLESERGAAFLRELRNEELEFQIYLEPPPPDADRLTQTIPYAIWENTKPFRQYANITFVDKLESANLQVKLLRTHEFDSPSPANEIHVGLGDDDCTGM